MWVKVSKYSPEIQSVSRRIGLKDCFIFFKLLQNRHLISLRTYPEESLILDRWHNIEINYKSIDEDKNYLQNKYCNSKPAASESHQLYVILMEETIFAVNLNFFSYLFVCLIYVWAMLPCRCVGQETSNMS